LINKLDDRTRISPSIPLRRLINPHQIISNVVSNIILLLSFGLCSPVLACYITLSTCVTGWCWSMLVGRFVSCRLDATSPSSPSSREDDLHSATNPMPSVCDPEVEDKKDKLENGSAVAECVEDGGFSSDSMSNSPQGTVDPFLTLLNHQLRGVASSLVACKWPVISTSCFFVTMLCWDMVGDEVGWKAGLWVPVAGAMMLLVVWLWDHLLVSKVIGFNFYQGSPLAFFSAPDLVSPASLDHSSQTYRQSVELVRPSLVSSPALPSPLFTP
jgi:hypothetical protein